MFYSKSFLIYVLKQHCKIILYYFHIQLVLNITQIRIKYVLNVVSVQWQTFVREILPKIIHKFNMLTHNINKLLSYKRNKHAYKRYRSGNNNW